MVDVVDVLEIVNIVHHEMMDRTNVAMTSPETQQLNADVGTTTHHSINRSTRFFRNRHILDQ